MTNIIDIVQEAAHSPLFWGALLFLGLCWFGMFDTTGLDSDEDEQ